MSANGLRFGQVRARALVLTVVVVLATTSVVATTSLLPCIAMGMPMGIEGVMRVTVQAEMFMHRDHGARPAALLCLVD